MAFTKLSYFFTIQNKMGDQETRLSKSFVILKPIAQEYQRLH